MRAFHHRGLGSRQRLERLCLAVLGLVCFFGAAACGEDTVIPAATVSATAEPPAAGGSPTVAAIELTDQGFSPDRTEISQGTRLTLRNATNSRQSVVVKGRDFGGSDGNSFTLEAGQSLDLNVHQLGAYILTLADDPRVTASIFIS